MRSIRGFSLIEVMVGLTLGLIMTIAVLGVYLAQSNLYKTNASQAAIQNAESAIGGLLIPVIRSSGYMGCSSTTQALSNLIAGGPAPLGTFDAVGAMIMGYDAAAGTTLTITHNNAANDFNLANWLPTLEASLQGEVQSVSDVVIVLGANPAASPAAVTDITTGSDSLTLQNTNGLTAGQFAAISDCSKALIFKITSVVGTSIGHQAGTGALTNAASAFSINFPIGSQVIPLHQTAFFVAHNQGGLSALVRATLNADGTWSIQSMVPGVQTMQVLYGIGTNGTPSQYVPASGVANWAQVYAVRLGFLIAGQEGSSTLGATQQNVMGTTINVPADTYLRHVFEITIHLRNAST